VDIDYEVFADDPAADVWIYATGFDKDANVSMGVRAISGEGAGAPVKPGKHRMTWDVTADYPGFNSTAFTVKMTALTGGAPYMVVDLSGGVDALSYPVSYLSSVPAGGWTDEYKTTKLVLRLIPPGSFMMGSPSDELGRQDNEDLHGVVLTKPFYIGVFEITQKQWELIMGSNPSYYKGEFRPVERVSFTMIRGSVNGIAYPIHNQVDADSFMGRLRSKVNMLFDLPTEAQWEYACRAGTATALNSGKNLTGTDRCANMAEVGRYAGNTGDGKGGYSEHTNVGSYIENTWGLYDMHGNVAEWCLDVYIKSLSNSSVVNPTGGKSGVSRVCKNSGPRAHGAYGGYWGTAASVRSAQRDGCNQDSYWYSDWNAYSDSGFRVVCLPAE
jgi:formylglycine-generating enzyme required for sulfatase activity